MENIVIIAATIFTILLVLFLAIHWAQYMDNREIMIDAKRDLNVNQAKLEFINYLKEMDSFAASLFLNLTPPKFDLNTSAVNQKFPFYDPQTEAWISLSHSLQIGMNLSSLSNWIKKLTPEKIVELKKMMFEKIGDAISIKSIINLYAYNTLCEIVFDEKSFQPEKNFLLELLISNPSFEKSQKKEFTQMIKKILADTCDRFHGRKKMAAKREIELLDSMIQ
jgi:hypothetical protein